MAYIKQLKEVLHNIIDDKLNSMKQLDFYVIREVNQSDLTCTIEKVNVGTLYRGVEFTGLGLGNGKGILKNPNVGDVVIAGFISNSEEPVILTTVFDTLSSEKDNKPQLRENEIYLANQANGATMLFRDDNAIVIRASTGAKFKLNNDGSFKIFDSNGYGVETDGSGDVNVYGNLNVYGNTNMTGYQGTSINGGSSQTGNF